MSCLSTSAETKRGHPGANRGPHAPPYHDGSLGQVIQLTVTHELLPRFIPAPRPLHGAPHGFRQPLKRTRELTILIQVVIIRVVVLVLVVLDVVAQVEFEIKV